MTAPARVGRYEIVRRLGKSMTDVFLAVDTVENRQAALKLIECGNDLVTKLVVEAERRGAAIQKQLQSIDSRIIEIYEYGEQDGYFFVAMQYVEGRNLAEVLRSEHAMDAVRAATIALEVCEQLAKFHNWQSAVVHGDIKPSNIHLGRNNTVRLLDFGIAKMLRPDGAATVHQFGSPSYCSPERLARSLVDQQSDLWAVGATLYEMLTGTPPYQAENTRKLESLIRSRRAPRALPASCPPGLRAIVTKALAPEAAQRYHSARELQADLQAFLEGRPTAAVMERRHHWSANSTVEAAKEYLRRATRTVRRTHRAVRVASAVGCFAAGMALWVGGALGYQAWHARRVAALAAPRVQSAARAPAMEPLAVLYRKAGERIIDAYRGGSARIEQVDWLAAEVYLERALSLNGADDRAEGELALSRGYTALARLETGSYTGAAAEQLALYARDEFELASEKIPGEAAAQKGIARVVEITEARKKKEAGAARARATRARRLHAGGRTWR
jgi:predicted Ser/Thr protein kinase